MLNDILTPERGFARFIERLAAAGSEVAQRYLADPDNNLDAMQLCWSAWLHACVMEQAA